MISDKKSEGETEIKETEEFDASVYNAEYDKDTDTVKTIHV